MLGKPGHRPGVRQQNGRVDHVGTAQVTRGGRGTRSSHDNSNANAAPTFAPRRAGHLPRSGDQISVRNLPDADRVAHKGRVPALSIVTFTTWALPGRIAWARPVTSDATRGRPYPTGNNGGDFVRTEWDVSD
ncbi:hypothetical protein GCM10027436_56700 [Actinophytocola sediminis]